VGSGYVARVQVSCDRAEGVLLSSSLHPGEDLRARLLVEGPRPAARSRRVYVEHARERPASTRAETLQGSHVERRALRRLDLYLVPAHCAGARETVPGSSMMSPLQDRGDRAEQPRAEDEQRQEHEQRDQEQPDSSLSALIIEPCDLGHVG
jgi:hypothetical protein